MKQSVLWILLLLTAAHAQVSHAELKIDPSKTTKEVRKILEPLHETVIRPYGDAHAADFGGPDNPGTFPDYRNSHFIWTFQGRSFYSNIGSFVPEIVPLEDCKPEYDTALSPDFHCDWQRRRFKVCHLFMFNSKDRSLESVTRLNIARDTKQLLGLPRCNSIQAMAVAKTVPDAMLITLGSIDSAAPADKHDEPEQFSSTLLLRFRDDHGKLAIEQDDQCLGNPNKYKTIAAARQALEKCAVAK